MGLLRDTISKRDIPLHGKITLIGRDPTCDVVVNSDRTSVRHALILHHPAGYTVEDLESLNGTFVNGHRIQVPTPLNNRDHIEIPGLHVIFLDPGEKKSLESSEPEQKLLIQSGLIQEEELSIPPGKDRSFSNQAINDNEQPGEDDALSHILSSLEVGGVGRLEVRPEAKLQAVLEISQALHNTLDPVESLPQVLDRLFRIFPHADRAFILLKDPGSGQFICRASRTRPPGLASEISLCRGILDHVLQTGRAVLSSDASNDERFDPRKSISRYRIGAILCVPLLGRGGQRLGVIQVDTRDQGHPFTEEDLEVLMSASSQMARSLELASLHHEQSDLEAAIRIQKSFLPSSHPNFPGLEFFDYYSAARLIGGDYYDYISLPRGRLAITLGDVSGKGIAAALLMARLSAMVRFRFALEHSLPLAVEQINRLMMEIDADRFITFGAAVINPVDFEVRLVNAGHPPMIFRKATTGEVSEVGIEEVGLPLGIFDRSYQETILHLDPGDCLILFTDGITEARDTTGDFFSHERLMAVVQKSPDSAAGIGQAILKEVLQFLGSRPQSDDITLLCVRRVAGSC